MTDDEAASTKKRPVRPVPMADIPLRERYIPLPFPDEDETMSGTERSSEGLDLRRRRILFRSWHRGMRETDLLLGRFADAHVADLSEAELDGFEALMEAPDDRLYKWLVGTEAAPADFDTALFRRVLAFHQLRATS